MESKTKEGSEKSLKDWKILSWNVNGIRVVLVYLEEFDLLWRNWKKEEELLHWNITLINVVRISFAFKWEVRKKLNARKRKSRWIKKTTWVKSLTSPTTNHFGLLAKRKWFEMKPNVTLGILWSGYLLQKGLHFRCSRWNWHSGVWRRRKNCMLSVETHSR